MSPARKKKCGKMSQRTHNTGSGHVRSGRHLGSKMAAEGSGGSVGKEKKIYGDVENEQDLFSKSKKRFYRKTQTELVIGYVVHVVLLGFYVFVRVYEATVIKRMSTESKEIAFPWSGMYGGRWRFLTYINLVRVGSKVELHSW